MNCFENPAPKAPPEAPTHPNPVSAFQLFKISAFILPPSSPATPSNPGRRGSISRPLKKRFPSNGGGKSRLYSDTSQSSSEYGYLFFGVGEMPRFDSTLISAMTTTYRPPLVVVDIVCDVKGRGTHEVVQRPLGLAEAGHNEPPVYRMRTDYGGVIRYSYCTPEFILGTTMSEDKPASEWALISSQNRSQGAIFSGNPKACIMPQTEKTHNRRAYNSVWSVQKNGTLICQKLRSNERSGRMGVWFASSGLAEPVEDDGWVFTSSEGAYAAVRVVDGGHAWEEENSRTKGKWLYCENEYSPVILEVGRKEDHASFEAFREMVTGNALTLENKVLKHVGINGDTFTFFTDYSKVPEIDGKPVDYAPAKAFDSPFLKSDWNSGVVRLQKGGRSMVLDFNGSPR